jgi:cell division protein FtsI/penicillin-binding protein 2
MAKTHRLFDKRIIVVQGLVLLWMLVIGAKLVQLQIANHDSLRARADRQHQASIDLSPVRGIIYDRNGTELARSVAVKSLYASPSAITNAEAAADDLARVLDIDRDALLRRLTSTSHVLVAVKRKLTDKEVAEVEKLNIPGLRYIDEMKRHYVTGGAAAHILGFVDYEEQGGAGIELSYEKLIRGQGGRLLLEVDALKKSYDHSVEESIPGANVTLTIDVMIQTYVERALAEAVRKYGARGGSIVVMRPSTGEILAMANLPTFNPNKISESRDAARQNRAIESSFEPGSIFKIVPYAAALEEGLITPYTRIQCPGEIRIADRVVNDRAYGDISAAVALAKSSNVAAIKIGQRLGNERLARYIEEFGFGRRTGVELPAEAAGVFRPADRWSPVTIGSIPMGHEIGVTAVQAAAAYACIANGGEWVKPHIVQRVTSSTGETLEEHQDERRQVVSLQTATTLKEMLEGVVLKGTGKAAQMGGYRAAGKTGTAQKIDEKTKRYSQTRYVASFAGFAPVDSPEVACIVAIDEPRFGLHHGGQSAAPVFARVVSDTLRLLGVIPEDDMIAGDSQVYDVPGGPEVAARSREQEDDSTESDAVVAEPQTDEVARAEYARNLVPDLRGLSLRQVMAECAARGLKFKPTGDGVVLSQSPPPGTPISAGLVCQVKLSKKSADKASKNEARNNREGEQKKQPEIAGRPGRAARTD